MHARCRIFSSKSTRKRLSAGLRPDLLGSLSAPPDPLAAKRGKEDGRDKGKKGEGELREREEKGREGIGGEVEG